MLLLSEWSDEDVALDRHFVLPEVYEDGRDGRFAVFSGLNLHDEQLGRRVWRARAQKAEKEHRIASRLYQKEPKRIRQEIVQPHANVTDRSHLLGSLVFENSHHVQIKPLVNPGLTHYFCSLNPHMTFTSIPYLS